MAPTVKIDNPSSHNYSLTGNASHYPMQMPNVPTPVFHAQEPRLAPLTPLPIPQQQHQTTQNQGLIRENENENEIARQKLEMLSRYMKTIKEKKNVHLMSICIKTFELSVQNRKIQMELDELREQTKKFLEELKANSMTTNLKAPMEKELPQQCPKLPYPNAMNITNVNNLYSRDNPSPFNQSNFQNGAHLSSVLDTRTMSIPVSSFPQNYSHRVEQIMSEPLEHHHHPNSIQRDGEIVKEELHCPSVLPCYGISNNTSNHKDQSPSDNNNNNDSTSIDHDSCSNTANNTEVENGEILSKRSVLTRRQEEKRIKNKNMSHQLQQRKTRGKISAHIQTDMSKYLDLISRKPTRRTRRGSISSASSTNISLDMKEKNSSSSFSKQNQMRRKTLFPRPPSSSSFSSCSELNLSQCSSPVSPFFSSSNWSTNDEFEDSDLISDTDMNERHMRIEI